MRVGAATGLGAYGVGAHRRSALIRLTPAGREAIRRVQRRERRYLARLDPPLDQARLADATATLAALLDLLRRP